MHANPPFRIAALVATLLAAACAQAFQPLITDDTGTQGAGGNQLELAGTSNKTRTATGTDKSGDVAFVYTRGLTDALDVFVEVGRQRIEEGGTTVKGPANPSVGAKWRFFENERKTSLALKPIYVAPLSADNETKQNITLGTGKSSYELSLILTQEMGWGAVHANLLTGRAKYRDTAANPNENTSQFSVAPVWNASGQWKLAVDLGVISTRAGGTTEKSRFGELGAIYSPNENLDFALGFIRETNRNTDETTKSVTAGLTWRFK